MSEIPCKLCLVLPICRNKTYGQMLMQCHKAYNYLYTKEGKYQIISKVNRKEDFEKNIKEMERTICPIYWRTATSEVYDTLGSVDPVTTVDRVIKVPTNRKLNTLTQDMRDKQKEEEHLVRIKKYDDTGKEEN
jgi:hypothetical protein